MAEAKTVKKKKQKVRFNIEIITDPNINPSKKDMSTILNYENLLQCQRKKL